MTKTFNKWNEIICFLLFIVIVALFAFLIFSSNHKWKNSLYSYDKNSWTNEELSLASKDFEIDSDVFKSISHDPWLLLSVHHSGGDAELIICIDLLNRKSTVCQIFFRTEEGSFTEKDSFRFTLNSGENILELNNTDFDFLRLDLTNEEDVEFRISSLELVSYSGKLSRSAICWIFVFVLLLALLIWVFWRRLSDRKNTFVKIADWIYRYMLHHPVVFLTIIISFSVLLCYRQFLFGRATFAYTDIGSDTVHAYQPLYYGAAFHLKEQDFSDWLSNFGLGTNASYIYTYFVDPFTWLPILFGAYAGNYWMQLSIAWMQVLRMLCCGLLCYYFLTHFPLRTESRILASYLYSFCGFLVLWGQHYLFATTFVYVTAAFCLLEEAIQSKHYPKKHVLFTVIVGVTAAYSYYAVYMFLLTASVYSIIRCIFLWNKSGWKQVFKHLMLLAIDVVVGFMLSAILFIPSVISITGNSDRLTTAGAKVLEDYPLIVSKGSMTGIICRMLSNNLQGIQRYTGGGNYYEAPQLFFSGLMPALMFLFFMPEEGEKLRLGRFFLVLVVVSLPFLNFVRIAYNGFVEPTGRYTYVLMPIYAVIAAGAFDRGTKNRRITLMTAILSALAYGLAFIILVPKLPEYGRVYIFEIYLLLLYLCALFFIRVKYGLKEGVLFLSVLFVLMLNVLTDTNATVNERSFLADSNPAMWKLADEVTSFEKTIEEVYHIDASQYRVDAIVNDHYWSNRAMVYNYDSVSGYNSVLNPRIKKFFEKCWPELIYGSSANRCLFSQDYSNTVMASLLGIKYVLSEVELNDPGYRFLMLSEDGVYVYENNSFSGFGQVYTSVMPMDVFDSLTVDEKQEKLGRYLVIEDAEEVYTATANAHVEMFRQNRDDRLSGSVVSDVNGYLFLPVPYQDGWEACINGQAAEIICADYGFIAIPILAGESQFSLEYQFPGFTAGAVISGAGILLLASMVALSLRFDKSNRQTTVQISPESLESESNVTPTISNMQISRKRVWNESFFKLKKHQFLFEELVKRDFKKKYKRTVLGILWSILSPLLMLLAMRLVFTQFFGRTQNHYTTFLFCGTLVFTYFAESTSEGMSALVGNAGIFTKVNVPKYLFLFSKNVQTLINFGITLVVFFLFCVLDQIHFTWRIVLLAYPTVCLMAFNLGLGMILSALFVFFKDIKYLWEVFTRLIMYMSAIFYSVDSYSQLTQYLFLLNPIYVFIRYFRKIVIDAAVPSGWFHLLMLAYAAISLGLGCLMYKKNNTKFLYYV